MSGNGDPGVTAYALGEGTEAERAAVEALLAGDPAARAEVEAVREAAAGLEAAFAAVPAPALPAERRAALERALAGEGTAAPAPAVPPGTRRPRLLRPLVGAAAAATLLGMALGAAGYTVAVGRGEVEVGRVPNYSGVFLDGEVALESGNRAVYSIGKGGREVGGPGALEEEADPSLSLETRKAAEVSDLRRQLADAEARMRADGGAGEGLRWLRNYRAPGDSTTTADWDSDGFENAGVGLGANASGKPSAGVFYLENSDGDFRGRNEILVDALDALEGGGSASEKEQFRRGKLDLDAVVSEASGETVVLDAGTVNRIREAAGKTPILMDTPVVGYLFLSDRDGDVRGRLENEFDRYTVGGGADGQVVYLPRESTTASYAPVVENPWIRPYGEAALSTFSIDVDTAGYSIVRRFLTGQNALPPADAVRIEELVNYFPWDYAPPYGPEPFAVHAEAASCPWEPTHRLVRVALKGKVVEDAVRPPANLVFLLDVSGSMNQSNKLPLVKESIELLAGRLDGRDRVAIVVYAGASGLVLPPTPGNDTSTIVDAIGRLAAGGSTNGGAGIELAYRVARENFVPGGINRVILATDGDFNVGVTDRASLVKLIEEKAKSNVFLTALGYGMDNLKDDTLEQLADRGNGNYGYVDDLAEARKILVDQGMSTLHTIAKDVKIQVEFNPAQVAGYRLLGYENRVMAAQDFADDRKDAGEIGAGHAVTAFYEVVPAGVEVPGAPVDELRYQRPGAWSGSFETLTVKLRWKEPEGEVSTLREVPFADAGGSFDGATQDFRFAAAVVEWGLLLRGSRNAGSASFAGVTEIATGALGADEGGWRAEFLRLVALSAGMKR